MQLLCDSALVVEDYYRAFAEGDLVAMHVRNFEEPGMKGTARIEIFRFDENGKIVERWNAIYRP